VHDVHVMSQLVRFAEALRGSSEPSP
jgi:hypothetical protein